jgi:hypothetical protein
MADLDPASVGTVLTNVPFGELIKSAALAVAEAQTELDKAALRVAEMMSGQSLLRDPATMLPIDANGMVPLRSEAGVYYASVDNSKRFEPLVVDTRVYFGRELDGTPVRMSMLELGFTPTFYQFVDTILEIKIALTLTQAVESQVVNQGVVTESSVTTQARSTYGARPGAWGGYGWSGSSQSSSQVQTKATPIDATYATRYNYAIEASSLFRTKLVPVPPPAILEQRIRQQMELEKTREKARTLPVAELAISPDRPRIEAGVSQLQLGASAFGPAGEQLIERGFTWSLGVAPVGVTVTAGGLLARGAQTGRATVSVACGGITRSVDVDLG